MRHFIGKCARHRKRSVISARHAGSDSRPGANRGPAICYSRYFRYSGAPTAAAPTGRGHGARSLGHRTVARDRSDEGPVAALTHLGGRESLYLDQQVFPPQFYDTCQYPWRTDIMFRQPLGHGFGGMMEKRIHIRDIGIHPHDIGQR